MSVVIETTIGDITVDLYLNERPKTCLNFIKLCKMKYYNLNLLFSIERNFIAQTGDPTGTGKGGSSVYEMLQGADSRHYAGEKIPIIKHKNMGLISMASCGNGLFGSQFFITLGDSLDSLDEEHLVFGEVAEGWETLQRLNDTLIDETKRPYQDILITHTVVLMDPYPELDGLPSPPASPLPSKTLLRSNYIAADESLESGDLQAMIEELAAKEAEARATILEMVGDLPSADAAPPENVLFVCKLNPVTTSEDLQVIFSRFGRVNAADVICDRETERSLQYAFVEFAEQRSCEDAYFKMDNVLIDERRIHVDFSQSVSRLRWRGKGKGVDHLGGGGGGGSDRKTRLPAEDAVKKSRYVGSESQRGGREERHRGERRVEDRFREENRKQGWHREEGRNREEMRTKERYGDGRGRDERFRQENIRYKDEVRREGKYADEGRKHTYGDKNQIDERERKKRREERNGDKMVRESRREEPSRSPSPNVKESDEDGPLSNKSKKERHKMIKKLKKELKKRKKEKQI